MRRILLAAALAVAALVAFAAPAHAHTEFEGSTPVNGARLDSSPEEVLLAFSGGVEVAPGGVTVVDAGGARVEPRGIRHPPGDRSSVAIALPRLRGGGYVVSWRVVSTDGHPLQGALSFTVGEAEPVSEARMLRLLPEDGPSRELRAAYGVSRALAFGSMLVLLGGVAFVVLVWPSGAADGRFRRLAWSALVVFALTSAANLVLQSAYVSGLGLGDALSPTVVGDALGTRFGRVYLLRFALIAACVGLLWVLTLRASVAAWWRAAALLVGIGIASTPGLAGHASVGSHQPYAFIADVIHVAAASVWLGGLVVMLFVALRHTEAATIAPRYSRMAASAVAILVATGLFQSWRQVGSLDALRTTEFGKALIVKMLLVVTVLVVAFVSRRIVRRQWDERSVQRLRRSVGVEAAIAVVVLSVTALLVNAVPAKSAVAAPQSGEITGSALVVDYTVTPGRVGRNQIHLYALTPSGAPQPVSEMTLTLRMPEREITPLDVDLTNAGPGHFRSSRMNVPVRGRWIIAVTARTSAGVEEKLEGSVDVR